MNKNTPIIAVLNDWGTVSDIFDGLGAVTLDVEFTSELSRAIRNSDALILTGGGDIDPERYGIQDEDKHPQVYGVSATRDDLEFAAVALARKHRIPVLGICRGHQLINVSHGGTLHQHLHEGTTKMHRHDGGDHSVKMRRSSFIGRRMRAGVLREVTSLHHQAVDRLGNGLIPVGWATDGTVEMIETAPGVKPYMLGTQFHPEIDAKMTGAKYNALGIFQAIYDKAIQHCASVGNRAERWQAVEDLEFTTKLNNYKPVKGYGTSSQTSVRAYLDAIPGTGSEDKTLEDCAYWEADNEDDSYVDWQRKNAMHTGTRTAGWTLNQADRMCIMQSGCKSPFDCLGHGDCAADVMQGVIKQSPRKPGGATK